MKELVFYKGNSYYLSKDGYFIRSERLHRRVWEDHYGEIPPDHHIHHKNGNTKDNRIENLECIEKREHHLLHFDKEAKLAVLHSPEVQERAHRWQKTARGKKISGRIAKESWKNRKPIPRTCVICGKDFETRNFTGTKYCGSKCRAKAGNESIKVEKICVICEKKFIGNKYKARACSPSCWAHLSWRTKRSL